MDDEFLSKTTDRTFNDLARHAKERGYKYHGKQKEMIGAAIREAYEEGQKNPIDQTPTAVGGTPSAGLNIIQFLVGEDHKRGRVLFKIVHHGVGRVFPLRVEDALALSDSLSAKAKEVMGGPKPKLVLTGREGEL